MAYITLKCRNCGGMMSVSLTSKICSCSHCGSSFLLSEMFDEKDIDFVEKLKPEDLPKMVEFSDAIKQGESSIYQGEFLKAEQSFKKAIELDEKNYKGYFGVVKAKTHNFNILPDSDDYKEYAKIALHLVDKDDQMHVKSELQKLDMLKTEKEELLILKKNQNKTNETKENKKRIAENFFSKLAYFLIILFVAGALLAIFLTRDFTNNNNLSAKTYEISSVEDFKKLYTDNSLLSSTIIIKTDLNFKNEVLNPIGTELNPFTGTFYGNGKTLSNFSIKNPNTEETNNIGLFGYTDGATLTGIVLDNVKFIDLQDNEFYSHNNLGLICGKTKNSSIKKCAVLDSCEISFNQNKNSSYSIGGVAGFVQNSIISFAYSNASISVKFDNVSYSSQNSLEFSMGGIVGEINDSKIVSTYSGSKLLSEINCETSDNIYSYSGGIVGKVKVSSTFDFYLNSCFFIGNLENDVNAQNKHQFVSGIVGFGAIFDDMNSNFVLFANENFLENNSSLLLSGISDYTQNVSSIEFVNSESEMIEKIGQILNDDWQDKDTLTPSLKYAS